MQVSAKLKLVRLELVDPLIHNTLEHDNLVSLCFAPMLKNAWNLSLIREINTSASNTLRNLSVNFRYVSNTPHILQLTSLVLSFPLALPHHLCPKVETLVGLQLMYTDFCIDIQALLLELLYCLD